MVIIHETPDRFTACRGSFMSICLYALTAPQSHPGRAQAMQGNLYHNGHKSPQRGTEGRRASTPAPRQQDSTTGGGRSVPAPRLESMVKPRSLGGRVCRRAGSRRAGVAALLPLLRLLKSVFLPFCPFWAFCDFCKSPFCGF